MRHAVCTVLAMAAVVAILSAFGGKAEAQEASPQASAAQQPASRPSFSFLPEKDPAADCPEVKFLEKTAGKHPRLLLSAERIPQFVAFYNSDPGKSYRDALTAYVPTCVIPPNRKTDDAWGQTVGLFRMPSLALHYVLTKDKKTFEKRVEFLKWLDELPHWTSDKGELDSDTTASFTMVGAAIMWDWLYDDLDPAFREKFRQDLWRHARVMYYGGHLSGNPGGNYWRGVPAYNHRWYRDWGLTLAALAASDGKPEEQWLLGRIEKELKFMADWLPEDGSQHEGPSYGSSAGALGMAMQASDECVGTKYLDNPFWKNAGPYAMALAAPGLTEALYFSDCGTKCLSFHAFFLKTAADHKQADVMDGLRQVLKTNAARWGVRDSMWFAFLCDHAAVTGGQMSKLPTTTFLPDLGISVERDSWNAGAVAALFKCGPPGGYKANSWRPTKKTENGQLPYLNVAHDHPNANSFILLADGEYLAETDRYPLKPGKLSTGLNTILVGGFGQVPDGRQDGDDWWQPGNGDMTKMGVITAWKDAGDVVVTEGEAAGSYLAYTDKKTKGSRPALDRFRRTFIWVKGGYVLVLDDVRASKPAEITWLMQGAKLEPVDEKAGRYRLSKGKASCEFQLLSDAEITAKMAVSTANDHNKLLNWQQLQATAKSAPVRFVSVFDPWNHKDLKLTFTPAGADKATIKVESEKFSDTWEWQAAAGQFEASTLHGTRKGGFDVTVDSKAVPPPAITGTKAQ